MSTDNDSVVVTRATPLQVADHRNFIIRYIVWVHGVIRPMPELKEPVFDVAYLPENTNPIKAVVYTWLYNYKKIEYSVEPTRRGFYAWIRLFLAIGLFVAIPVSVILGVLGGGTMCVMKFCGFLDATFNLMKSISLLMLGLIGLILLVYLIYLILAAIFHWPIKLPAFNIVRSEGVSS